MRNCGRRQSGENNTVHFAGCFEAGADKWLCKEVTTLRSALDVFELCVVQRARDLAGEAQTDPAVFG